MRHTHKYKRADTVPEVGPLPPPTKKCRYILSVYFSVWRQMSVQMFVSISKCRYRRLCLKFPVGTGVFFVTWHMTHWAQSGTSNSLILVFKDWEWLWSSGWSGLITRYFTCTRQYPWPQFLFSISCEKDLFQVIYISECSGGSLKWKFWCTYRGQQPPWWNEGSPGVLGGQVIRWLGGHVCRLKLGVRSWFLDAVRNEYENICGVMFQN